MAVDKGLVRSALEIKYKGKSLSKTSKDKLAEAYAPVIENAADIDDFINGQNAAIEILIAETDSRVTEALKKAPKEKPANAETSTEEIELPADTPDWAKAMMKQNQELSKKIEGFENKQSQTSLEQRFRNHPDLKGIPEIFLKGRIPQTEEELDSVVAEVKADVSAYETTNKITIIGKDTPPGAGGATGGGAAENVDVAPEIKAFVEKNAPK